MTREWARVHGEAILAKAIAQNGCVCRALLGWRSRHSDDRNVGRPTAWRCCGSLILSTSSFAQASVTANDGYSAIDGGWL